MLDLVTTFLAVDLALAAVLAVILGTIVVVQAVSRATVARLRRSTVPASAAAAVASVRVPAPRGAELVGSGR